MITHEIQFPHSIKSRKMRTSFQYLLACAVLLFLTACGGTQSEETKKNKGEQPKTENSKTTNKEAPTRNVSEKAKLSSVHLAFKGFIDKSYDEALDVLAQQMFKNGPMLVTIVFDTPEEGGGSLSFSTPKFEVGTYELAGAPSQGASVASGKYMFSATSGVLNITAISDEFVEGTATNVVFKENTNADVGGLELTSCSFKIPLNKK